MKKFFVLSCSLALLIMCVALIGCSSVKKIKYTLEAGEPLPSAAELVGGSKRVSFDTDMSNFDTSKVGTYSIEISGAHRSYIVKLKIVDTTAPVGEVRDLCVGVGAPIPEPKDFFVSVKESAIWTAEFRENYIFSAKGEYSLAITLSDEHGNKADYNVGLSIINDTTPPTISGPYDISLYVGDAVSYKKDFSVSDDCFGAVTLDVDVSAVDTSKEGTYTAIYTATDASGNKATKSVTVWVHDLKITDDMLWKKVDTTISYIIKDGMTKEEQCRAIYNHVSKNIFYHPDSDKTDWVAEAYRGMYVSYGGDCFTFYAIAKAFMERLGIEYIDMQRLPGYSDTTHFWLMVNIGDENTPVWYHYDLCPVRHDAYYFSGGLYTDKQVDAYNTARPHYYERDKSKYPATATEIITPTPSLEDFYS